ncbi:MAG: DUF433 domain-containing protein [Cyanobacteriota bacterium]|nr:DUF433 domain-containing protein [Cyanobacteriota bacterium]
MYWREYIHSNPKILFGKPVVKGTRLSVEFILGLFAVGWTEEQVLENYPGLTAQQLQAVFAFTVDCMRDLSFYQPVLREKDAVSRQ